MAAGVRIPVGSPTHSSPCIKRTYPHGWSSACSRVCARKSATRSAGTESICSGGVIRVDEEVTKTGMRRIVHPKPNAVEWLKLGKALGARLPFPEGSRRKYTRRLRACMGWAAWPQDILRHTAASHLLAVHSPGHVSSELGNSEAVLKRDYKELVYQEEARAFFGIRPKARHLARFEKSVRDQSCPPDSLRVGAGQTC